VVRSSHGSRAWGFFWKVNGGAKRGRHSSKEKEMLKIVICSDREKTTLKLEGQLAGPSIKILERFWRRVRDVALDGWVRIDLSSLLFIDHEGKKLLNRMHEDGMELIASDGLMKYVAEAIAGSSPSTSSRADRGLVASNPVKDIPKTLKRKRDAIAVGS
jgi:hypothetical protein